MSFDNHGKNLQTLAELGLLELYRDCDFITFNMKNPQDGVVQGLQGIAPEAWEQCFDEKHCGRRFMLRKQPQPADGFKLTYEFDALSLAGPPFQFRFRAIAACQTHVERVQAFVKEYERIITNNDNLRFPGKSNKVSARRQPLLMSFFRKGTAAGPDMYTKWFVRLLKRSEGSTADRQQFFNAISDEGMSFLVSSGCTALAPPPPPKQLQESVRSETIRSAKKDNRVSKEKLFKEAVKKHGLQVSRAEEEELPMAGDVFVFRCRQDVYYYVMGWLDQESGPRLCLYCPFDEAKSAEMQATWKDLQTDGVLCRVDAYRTRTDEPQVPAEQERLNKILQNKSMERKFLPGICPRPFQRRTSRLGLEELFSEILRDDRRVTLPGGSEPWLLPGAMDDVMHTVRSRAKDLGLVVTETMPYVARLLTNEYQAVLRNVELMLAFQASHELNIWIVDAATELPLCNCSLLRGFHDPSYRNVILAAHEDPHVGLQLFAGSTSSALARLEKLSATSPLFFPGVRLSASKFANFYKGCWLTSGVASVMMTTPLLQATCQFAANRSGKSNPRVIALARSMVNATAMMMGLKTGNKDDIWLEICHLLGIADRYGKPQKPDLFIRILQMFLRIQPDSDAYFAIQTALEHLHTKEGHALAVDRQNDLTIGVQDSSTFAVQRGLPHRASDGLQVVAVGVAGIDEDVEPNTNYAANFDFFNGFNSKQGNSLENDVGRATDAGPSQVFPPLQNDNANLGPGFATSSMLEQWATGKDLSSFINNIHNEDAVADSAVSPGEKKNAAVETETAKQAAEAGQAAEQISKVVEEACKEVQAAKEAAKQAEEEDRVREKTPVPCRTQAAPFTPTRRQERVQQFQSPTSNKRKAESVGGVGMGKKLKFGDDPNLKKKAPEQTAEAEAEAEVVEEAAEAEAEAEAEAGAEAEAEGSAEAGAEAEAGGEAEAGAEAAGAEAEAVEEAAEAVEAAEDEKVELKICDKSQNGHWLRFEFEPGQIKFRFGYGSIYVPNEALPPRPPGDEAVITMYHVMAGSVRKSETTMVPLNRAKFTDNRGNVHEHFVYAREQGFIVKWPVDQNRTVCPEEDVQGQIYSFQEFLKARSPHTQETLMVTWSPEMRSVMLTKNGILAGDAAKDSQWYADDKWMQEVRKKEDLEAMIFES